MHNQDVIAVNNIAAAIHRDNVLVGWWDKPRNDGEMMMLIVSEVAEAMEGHRTDAMDKHLPHRRNVEVEMADAVIRIMDYCAGRGLDLGGAMQEKLAFNAQRQDHKREARALAGGKKY